MKLEKWMRNLIAVAGAFLLVVIIFFACCTVVDSGEVGIKFHKWSANEQDYGGVEGTCKGWSAPSRWWEYPDLKPTTFTWHPATESPGKRRILMAMTRHDLQESQYVFQTARFFSNGVRPAECEFRDANGNKTLPVAWAFYDDVIKAIAPWMVSRAESAAWAWWPEKKEG